MVAVPGRLDIEIAGCGVGALALAEPHFNVEGRPPLPLMRRRALKAEPALSGGEIVEPALGMERGQRAGEVMGVLGLEVTADQGEQVGVHGRALVLCSSSYKVSEL